MCPTMGHISGWGFGGLEHPPLRTPSSQDSKSRAYARLLWRLPLTTKNSVTRFQSRPAPPLPSGTGRFIQGQKIVKKCARVNARVKQAFLWRSRREHRLCRYQLALSGKAAKGQQIEPQGVLIPISKKSGNPWRGCLTFLAQWEGFAFLRKSHGGCGAPPRAAFQISPDTNQTAPQRGAV